MNDVEDEVQVFRVKEGLGCVLFRVVAARKTRNLALPSLENPVYGYTMCAAELCYGRTW